MKKYNAYCVYCDESSVENQTRYFVIGALIVPKQKKYEFINKFKDIISSSKFNEIKWSKSSKVSLPYYQKIIDLFFESEFASYYCIVVDKNTVDLKLYHNDDRELSFYKFYYLLLKEKLYSNADYYIFLDRKPVKIKNRVGVLRAFLNGFIKSSRTECNIRQLQEYSSTENKLIQIADLFTGAVSAKFNSGNNLNETKLQLINYIEKKRGKSLDTPSLLSENKFNIFKWIPKQK